MLHYNDKLRWRTFRTKGPREVKIRFSSDSRELVAIDIEGAIIVVGNKVSFMLDRKEFKSLLKTALKFDEDEETILNQD